MHFQNPLSVTLGYDCYAFKITNKSSPNNVPNFTVYTKLLTVVYCGHGHFKTTIASINICPTFKNIK